MQSSSRPALPDRRHRLTAVVHLDVRADARRAGRSERHLPRPVARPRSSRRPRRSRPACRRRSIPRTRTGDGIGHALRLSMARTLICCALVLVASVVPRAGRADGDSREQAGAAHARGIELAEQGLYAAAPEQFRSAYEKSPHFAVLYNIGQAQMALGRPIEAIEALTRYLRDGVDQVPLSRREQVHAQIALLESRLAELSVTTDRPGALVTVDG